MWWRIPLATVVAFGAAAAAVTACSLLTSTDGLAGSAAPADAMAETSTPVEGGTEASSPIDAGDGGDSSDADSARSKAYAAAVVLDHPLGYWRLEEASGTVAKDEMGKFDGAYVLAPTLGQPGAAGSRAITLPKDSNARIKVDVPDFRFPGKLPYSVEAWVIPGVQKNYEWIGGTEIVTGGVRSGWSLFADDNGSAHYEVWTPDGDGGSKQVRGTFFSNVGNLVTGKLAHVVAVWDGTTVIPYLNGVRGQSLNSTGTVPDTGVLIWGCRGDINHCLDDWTIDELAVYDYALAEARVAAHYNLGK